jgi:hypothetical protein
MQYRFLKTVHIEQTQHKAGDIVEASELKHGVRSMLRLKQIEEVKPELAGEQKKPTKPEVDNEGQKEEELPKPTKKAQAKKAGKKAGKAADQAESQDAAAPAEPPEAEGDPAATPEEN